MDTARQVVRWSIPGSVLMVIAATFYLSPVLVSDYLGWQINSGDLTPAEVALLTLLTIPVGFLVYQSYYSGYGAVWLRGIVNSDRGAVVLEKLPPRVMRGFRARCMPNDSPSPPEVTELEVPYWALPGFLITGRAPRKSRKGATAHFLQLALWHKRAVNRGEYRKAAGAYQTCLLDNWQMVRMLVTIQEGGSLGRSLAAEYTTLSDIYHALGAVRAAVFVGGTLGPFISLLAPAPSLTARIIGCAVSLVLSCLLFRIMWRNRRRTHDRLCATLQHGLGWLSGEIDLRADYGLGLLMETERRAPRL